MSPQGTAQREHLLAMKEQIKPKRCKNSSTGWCIARGVIECAVIDCGEGAVLPWEDLYV